MAGQTLRHLRSFAGRGTCQMRTSKHVRIRITMTTTPYYTCSRRRLSPAATKRWAAGCDDTAIPNDAWRLQRPRAAMPRQFQATPVTCNDYATMPRQFQTTHVTCNEYALGDRRPYASEQISNIDE